jgi:hypothetical protein
MFRISSAALNQGSILAQSTYITALICLLAACGEPQSDPSPRPTSDAGLSLNMDAKTPLPDAGPPPPTGIPLLGNYTHSVSDVTFTVIATAREGLNQPTDLEFHPERDNELWASNQGNSTFWIATNPGQPNVSFEPIPAASPKYNLHFLAKVSALAFSDQECGSGHLCLATSHDNVNDQPQITQNGPMDFMGPTLWTSDVAAYFERANNHYHMTHYDMLHNSPNGLGIAWDSGNAFWYFDGYHQSITRYDFSGDHGPGGTDHTDAVISRWVQGFVRPLNNVPSHLEFDQTTSKLYIADTGNNRIAVIDTSMGVRGGTIGPNYDGCSMYSMQSQLDTLIDGNIVGLSQPSGLAIHNDMIFVSDHGTGRIYAFDMDGELVDYLDTGLGQNSLTGITFDKDGNLFVADRGNEQILKISPQ